ncbi:MAG: hypothetical protein ACLQFR_19860 [Streptosporangiaceae bacterium]
MRAGHIYAIAAGTAYSFGSSGDGGPATRAELEPVGVAEDRAGDLTIAEPYVMGLVRFRPATSGTFFGQTMTKGDIYTIARNIAGQSIAFDKAGNVLTASAALQVLAARNGTFYGQQMTTGHVYTLPNGGGTGIAVDSHGHVLTADGARSGYAGDGGPAIRALLDGPSGVAVSPSGYLLIADAQNLRVRSVAP